MTTPVTSVSVYETEDGTNIIRLRTRNGSVWLTQADMAELFQTSVSLMRFLQNSGRFWVGGSGIPARLLVLA